MYKVEYVVDGKVRFFVVDVNICPRRIARTSLWPQDDRFRGCRDVRTGYDLELELERVVVCSSACSSVEHT